MFLFTSTFILKPPDHCGFRPGGEEVRGHLVPVSTGLWSVPAASPCGSTPELRFKNRADDLDRAGRRWGGNRVGCHGDKDKSQIRFKLVFIGFDSQWLMDQFEVTTQSSASTQLQQHNTEQPALCGAGLDLEADGGGGGGGSASY